MLLLGSLLLYTGYTIIPSIFKYMYAHTNVRVMSKNIYEVDYYLNGTRYTVCLKRKRGPSEIVCIEDERGIDVSKHLKRYMGPNNDFHNSVCQLRPRDLEYTDLYFHKFDGDIIHFEIDDIIEL